MKQSKLLEKMERHGVKLPQAGSGKGGKILNRDLEAALGDHFLVRKQLPEKELLAYLIRRNCPPMKAYRYNQLPEKIKETIWDNGEWRVEEKLNGWRMMIVFIPGHGFTFFGGNISDVDFLPINYTEHIVLKLADKAAEHPQNPCFHETFSHTCIIDTEAICHDAVEMTDGQISSTTLEAVGALLGCLPERSRELQREATLEFHCFDHIRIKEATLVEEALHVRKMQLAALYLSLSSTVAQFKFVRELSGDKKKNLNDIWREGGEGVILKHRGAPYVPGGRLRTHQVKVKRTMSGEIGDDIDCFITCAKLTKEWTKKNLIGAIELGVYLPNGKTHHIATVSGMPDEMRKELTRSYDGALVLNPDYFYAIVVVNGQELSARNQKLMHAVVDWDRGFRKDKYASDCVLSLKQVEETRY